MSLGVATAMVRFFTANALRRMMAMRLTMSATSTLADSSLKWPVSILSYADQSRERTFHVVAGNVLDVFLELFHRHHAVVVRLPLKVQFRA